MSHPRDPRNRRVQRDPLAAAVALELAADGMRAGLRSPEPEQTDVDPQVLEQVQQWDAAAGHLTHTVAEEVPADLAEQLAEAATEQGDEPEPACPECGHFPEDHPHAGCSVGQPVETVEEPAPSVTPAAPVFSSEHPPAAWRSRHDPRSLGYGASRLLRGSGPLQDVRLANGPVLDQMLAGTTLEEQSCCTGCGIVAAHNTAGGVDLGLADAEKVYDLARTIDQFPGDHTAGTSVIGAMQAATQLGVIGGYLWCFGTRDIAQTLIQRRLPVVVGVRWRSGMWETGPGGLVQLVGDDTGMGHCLAIVGLSLKGPQGQPGPYFVWQNSAGESYGDHGFGYIHHRDLSTLLRGVGEAAVPTLEPQDPR